MDGFTAQLQAEAAEAEGILPEPSQPSTPHNESAQEAAMPSLSSMFGFAASWGKKLQTELQLDGFVDQVKRQSEQVTKAYTQDLAEFAQAVRVGAAKGMDEISHRITQLKTDMETGDGERNVDGGLLGGIVGRHLQVDVLREQQGKAKRLLARLGADLEDLVRDAIVIEAPGSGSTEEQRTAARKIIYDRRMARMAALEESEDTFLEDPSDMAEYKAFIKDVDTVQNKKEAERLVDENPQLKNMLAKLVPKHVDQEVFWTRYFFRVWMVDQEEIRRRKMVEAAVAASAEDEFSWDMEEDEDEEKGKGKEKEGIKEKQVEQSGVEVESAKAQDIGETAGKVVAEAASEAATPNASASNAAASPVDEKKSNASTEKPDSAAAAAAAAATKAPKDTQTTAAAAKGSDDDAWDEWE
ncbi:BSD domain-containing protein 1 [Coemansia sp. Benny D115]|nr:BSD domain-containing protein 1 [Coemansia sp. Benny D115]